MAYLLWGLAILVAVVVLGFIVLVAFGLAIALGVRRRYGNVTCSPLMPRQCVQLFEQIEQYFRARGAKISIRDCVAHVHFPGDDEPHQMGLQNLMQQCAQVDPQQWAMVIDGHFDSLEKGRAEQEQILKDLDDFDKVRPLLAVRLMPKEAVPLDNLVWREDLEGTITNLVYDLPSSIRSVHPDERAKWPIGQDELFKIALENTWRLSQPQSGEVDVGDDVKLIGVASDDHYVSGHALMLDHHPEWLGPYGALVAVPHRHSLLLYPIRDTNVVPAVYKIAAAAMGMEKEGPGSITSRLYWYRRDGSYVHLPYDVTDRQFNFRPPEQFVEMLNALAQSESPRSSGGGGGG